MKTLTSLDIWGPAGGGGGKASIIRLGPSWFTSTLYFILIYMSNKQYDNTLLSFKIKKVILYFFFVMLGPYIKSKGTRGTEMSANADLITMETYVQQGETI